MNNWEIVRLLACGWVCLLFGIKIGSDYVYDKMGFGDRNWSLFHSIRHREWLVSKQDFGEVMPKFHGFAYFDYQRLRAVSCPIPFNWIVWAAREIYSRLKEPPSSLREKAFGSGWAEGHAQGMEKGIRQIEESYQKVTGSGKIKFGTLSKLVEEMKRAAQNN